MYIKKLEIYGFKSFPYKTVIPFSKGITAIVGPNGSGKSNILDAIKWVLGEQSPKRLRIKELSDLLYSGNNDKKIDFAEVKLVFSHQPPLFEKYKDYEEIVIIRRFYRDGEGEFFINQKSCRLKDIQFLFLDLGINPQSYGIIDQGEVNKFLEISPKERRRFLEDLAGVSKMKLTEEETEKNLKETEINLIRIQDILKEVENQYYHLREQAEKAKKFLNLKETLKNLHLKKIYFLYKKTLKEKEEIIKNQNSMKINKIELEKQYETIEEAEKDYYKNLISLEREFKDLKKEKNEKEDELKKIESELIKLYEEEKGITVKIEKEKIKEINELKKREELKKQLEFLRNELESKKIRVSEITNKLNQIKEEKKELEPKIINKKRILQELREEFNKINNEIIKTKERKNFIDREKRKFYKELENLKEEKIKIEKIFEKINDEKTVLENIIKNRNEEIQNLEREILNLKKKEENIKENLNKIKEKKIQYQTELKNWQENLKLLDQILQKEERELNTKWLSRTLGNLIKEEPEKIELLEFFYRDLLKAILVKDLKEIEEISNREEQNLIFIREKDLKELPIKIKDAKSVEEIPERLDYFLYMPYKSLLLTPYGFILSIKKRKKGYFSLTKEREIIKEKEEKTKNLLDNLLKDEKIFMEALQTNQNKLKELLNRDIAIKEELKGASNTLNQINQQRIRWEENLKEIQRKIENLEKDILQIEKEEKKIKEEVKDLIIKKEELVAKKEKLEKDVIELERTFKSKETTFITLEKELIKVRTESEEILKRINEIQAEIEKTEKFLKDFSHRQELLNNELVYIREKLKNKNNKLEIIQKEYNQLLEKNKATEEKLENLNKGLRGLFDAKKKIEKEINIINNIIHNNEIKLAELNLLIENLKKEWWEWNENKELKLDNTEIEINNLNVHDITIQIEKIKEELKTFQEVNFASIKEFEQIAERYNYLLAQKEDLEKALINIKEMLKELREKAKKKIIKTLIEVNAKLLEIFPLVMEGGRAELYFTEEDPLKAGLELKIHLPHKNIKHLHMLSGGEKSLCVIALLIAFYLTKPGPFCVLDEIDAALDEKNSLKFVKLLKRIKNFSQIILITHNPNVMKEVDTLIGVTTEEKGVSKVVKLEIENHK